MGPDSKWSDFENDPREMRLIPTRFRHGFPKHSSNIMTCAEEDKPTPGGKYTPAEPKSAIKRNTSPTGSIQSSDGDSTIYLEKQPVSHKIPTTLNPKDERKDEWTKFVKKFGEVEKLLKIWTERMHKEGASDTTDGRQCIEQLLSIVQNDAINHLHNGIARIKVSNFKQKWYRDQMVQCGAMSILVGSYLVKMASMEADDQWDRAGSWHMMMLLQPELCEDETSNEAGKKNEKGDDDDASMDF